MEKVKFTVIEAYEVFDEYEYEHYYESCVAIKEEIRLLEEQYEPQSNRTFTVEQETTDNQTYKKAYKVNFCKKTGKCSFCPPHGGGDNANPGYKRRNSKSWKSKKLKNKYKTVEFNEGVY
jgi:hypothetical protein